MGVDFERDRKTLHVVVLQRVNLCKLILGLNNLVCVKSWILTLYLVLCIPRTGTGTYTYA
jgi:hypothetical protein